MWADQPPKLWLPPKPAIIRQASPDLRKAVSFLVAPLILGKVGPPTTVAWTYSNQTNSPSAAFNWGSVPLGAASLGRHILVVIGWDGAVTSTSVTVGGVAATQLLINHVSQTRQAIWVVPFPTGTTGALITNMSGFPSNGIGVDVFAIPTLQSTTPVDSFVVSSNVADFSTNEISAPADSCVIAARYCVSTVFSWTHTWTGLTEKSDRQCATQACNTAACANFAAAASPLTIGCASTVGLVRGAFSAVCMK